MDAPIVIDHRHIRWSMTRVFDGSKLSAALNLVRKHNDDFILIMAYRAKLDFDGQTIPDKRRRWEIWHNWEKERAQGGVIDN